MLLLAALSAIQSTTAFSFAACFRNNHSNSNANANNSKQQQAHHLPKQQQQQLCQSSTQNEEIATATMTIVDRRKALTRIGMLQAQAQILVLVTANQKPETANAIPPSYVIAEELGYFPVTNRAGETSYISARVKRSSTQQAIDLARYLSSKPIQLTFYGAFWCPHCQRQKEMFGKEAWDIMRSNNLYVECDARGADGGKAGAAVCLAKGIDGFPSWRARGTAAGNNKSKSKLANMSGEMPLAELARRSGFPGKFDASLEPDLMNDASGSCR